MKLLKNVSLKRNLKLEAVFSVFFVRSVAVGRLFLILFYLQNFVP